MSKRSIVPGQIEGFLEGCPFCTARQKGSPAIGRRFRIISGLSAGETGVVIRKPESDSLRRTEILAHMDQYPEGCDRCILIDHELIQELPTSPIPKWAPFLSLADAAILDSAVVKFCSSSFSDSQWQTNWPVFFEVIRLVWQHRLPVTGAEFDDILSGHGVCKPWRRGLSKFFDRGLALLVYANGRKPVKNKRTKTRLGQ